MPGKLEIGDLHHSRNGRVILEGVDLSLEPGEIRLLVGASGAGKTTLLRLIAGFDAPDRGWIDIDRRRMSSAGTVLVAPHRRGVAMVFQDGALWSHLTVERHLTLGLSARVPDRAARGKLVNEILDLVGLSARRLDRPGHLSGGERQRLGLARALAQQPRLLLLDEPLAHVDVPAQKDLAAMMTTLIRDRGITALWVTHRPDEVTFTSGEVSVLAGGTIERGIDRNPPAPRAQVAEEMGES